MSREKIEKIENSNTSVLIGKDGKLSCGHFTGDLSRLLFFAGQEATPALG
jgi:hypothetical protein